MRTEKRYTKADRPRTRQEKEEERKQAKSLIAYSLFFCYDKRTVRKAVKRGTLKRKAEEKEGWV